MTSEIKINSSTKISENKGNLDDFNQKKEILITKRTSSKYYQLKLLMHKGKLIADSGNTEFTKVDEIKNLEDFMNLIENSDVDGSESDVQQLAKFKILASEEIRSKVELDAIDE